MTSLHLLLYLSLGHAEVPKIYALHTQSAMPLAVVRARVVRASLDCSVPTQAWKSSYFATVSLVCLQSNAPDCCCGRRGLRCPLRPVIVYCLLRQAGARKVYAVEASGMARFARRLADGNPELGQRIQIINSKVEEANVPEKVGKLEEAW